MDVCKSCICCLVSNCVKKPLLPCGGSSTCCACCMCDVDVVCAGEGGTVYADVTVCAGDVVYVGEGGTVYADVSVCAGDVVCAVGMVYAGCTLDTTIACSSSFCNSLSLGVTVFLLCTSLSFLQYC